MTDKQERFEISVKDLIKELEGEHPSKIVTVTLVKGTIGDRTIAKLMAIWLPVNQEIEVKFKPNDSVDSRIDAGESIESKDG